MVLDYSGSKDEPQAIPSGAAPTFAADLSELATWLAEGRTFRRFATVSDLGAASGAEDRDVALVDDVDGAFFRYDGSAGEWVVCGTPRFASTGARDSALTAPAAGDRARVAIWEYVRGGSSWLLVPQVAAIVQRTSNQSIPNSSTTDTVVVHGATSYDVGAFTISSGVLKCVTAGTYRFRAWNQFAGNGSGLRWCVVQKALAATPTVFSNVNEMAAPAGASGTESQVALDGVVTLAAGDRLRSVARQNSGGALNLTQAGLELVRIA